MNLELNRRLALLLGWSNIVDVGGALLGQPPAGEPECRSQAAIPDWAGSWSACGPLMVANMDVTADDFRAAIVLAAIAKLEK
jgi:hypothetical protein